MQGEVIGISRQRAPDDGIVASHRPRGPLGRQWLALFQTMAGEYQDRLARGRSWARGGRVRDLWFAPGVAGSEVYDTEPRHPVIRVRVFEPDQWAAALRLLSSNLQHIAALVEGELPPAALLAFKEAGLQLVPTVEELEPDCTCQDYALPCAHVAALQHVLADALDGDPFLLLTLRGRPREQILAALRRSWGDLHPFSHHTEEMEEPPPHGDWFQSGTPLPPIRFTFSTSEGPLGDPEAAEALDGPLGLLELGPAPGQADLERALRPLYTAGARAAIEVALRDSPTRADRRRVRRRAAWAPDPHGSTDRPTQTAHEEGKMESIDDSAAVSDAGHERNREAASADQAPAALTLTERIVDHLAQVEYAQSADLARRFGVSTEAIRCELVDLEQMGIVYRTGQTRGTRWWLG